MRRKKIAILLIFVMLFASTTSVGAQDEQEETLILSRFSDMPDDWSTQALQRAVDNGLMSGSDGLIKPKDPLTRAQMATIINRAFGAKNMASISNFEDVSTTAWYYHEMAKAIYMKTFLGDGNHLYPDNPITRQEAFLVIARALGINASTFAPAGFIDLDDIAPWARGEIYALINQGYIQGSAGKINPKQTITRAEFAQLMHNLIKTYIKEPGEYTDLLEGNVMVLVPGVVFVDTMITGDLILGEGVTENDVVLSNSTLTGRWIIRTQQMEKQNVIGMVADVNELGEDNFNNLAFMGLKKAEDDLNVITKKVESVNEGDYSSNLAELAQEEPELIITVGFLMIDATTEAAENYPNQKFVIIDDNSIDLNNVMRISFAEHEGSFLVGVIAGMTTETNVVGFIGGMQFPLIEKFMYGYMAGVKSVNPDAEVLIDYANSFMDPETGKELALSQNELGADVIYHASGGTGFGVIEAAGEADFWAIGVDVDQSYLDPEHVLCSMYKRIDNVVYMAIQSVLDGNFEGVNVVYGLKEEAIGYVDGAGNISIELADTADFYKRKIIAGDIVVPYDLETFEAFMEN
ncbi:MAG: BMP family ABC transporter substrate-binding protein [Tissierellales bacterium]|nr:BMP family ABC transporter substrate-binding protein [Tissierellales bacterium]MBN2828289.1 BMP family ABC transporter substrate-binding protein [Tissierellales bacterium]